MSGTGTGSASSFRTTSFITVAAYIRNVSKASGRIAEIETLTTAVVSAGSHLVLAQDSSAMAEHMASIGLITHADVSEVEAERAKAGDRGRGNLQTVSSRPVSGEAETAATEVGELLRSTSEPTTVIVEPTVDGSNPSGTARSPSG